MNLSAFLTEHRTHFQTADSIPDEHMPGFLGQHVARIMRMPFCSTAEDAAAASEELERTARADPMGSDEFDEALRRRLAAYLRAAFADSATNSSGVLGTGAGPNTGAPCL